MSTEELEVEALKLAPQERARLAAKLLESLENLSEDENARLWAEEAIRRDQAWDADPEMERPAGPVRQRQQQGGATCVEHGVAGGAAQAEAAGSRGCARGSEDSSGE